MWCVRQEIGELGISIFIEKHGTKTKFLEIGYANKCIYLGQQTGKYGRNQ
jgi:hypothetical protein